VVQHRNHDSYDDCAAESSRRTSDEPHSRHIHLPFYRLDRLERQPFLREPALQRPCAHRELGRDGADIRATSRDPATQHPLDLLGEGSRLRLLEAAVAVGDQDVEELLFVVME